MADILEFGKKAQDLKSIKDSDLRERKIEALRKLFQCTRCMLKCSKCGAQLDAERSESDRYAAPFPFCGNCQEEYQEYRNRVSGKQTSPSYYWHNDVWFKMWQCWLDHQNIMNEYRQTKEFLQLIEEVEDLLKQ